MNKKFRLSTALDIDDLLLECVPYALHLANEKYQFDPPLSIYEVNRWGKLGTRADVIFEFFNDPEFYQNQPPIAGAQEFVRKLCQMTEVFVSTSTYPQFMGLRAQRIMELFPEINSDHIYMGSRKDKIDVDILFDDGMHNILASPAAYPILMRRPWNQEATGMLAVNNYDEFLKLVEIIAESYSVKQDSYVLHEPGIVVLVGPSGSGKTEIARKILTISDKFQKLVSYTTNLQVHQEEWYHYVPETEFQALCENGEMFESTTYAGHFFGSMKSDVESILSQGKHVLTVMDICGAMAMKTHFPHVITIYTKREKKSLMSAIIEREIPTAEKVNRLLAIEAEKQNAGICDYVIDSNDVDAAAAKILSDLDVR